MDGGQPLDGGIGMDGDGMASFGDGPGFGPAFGGGPGGAASGEAAQRPLSRLQKAAVIVRLLISEGIELSLADLPEEIQDELVQQMARMRSVDNETLTAIASEFAAEIDAVALSFPRGIAGALGALGNTISPIAADRFRRQLGAEAMGDPWERVAALSTEDLLPILKNESVEVGAVVLSKLKVSKAADLLGQLPGPKGPAGGLCHVPDGIGAPGARAADRSRHPGPDRLTPSSRLPERAGGTGRARS